MMQTAELKPLMQTLAPMKVFGARLQADAYEVSVQDICWTEPGEIHLLSGRHCLIELAEAPAPGRARYRVETPDGREHAVGMLNVMPPASARTVRWNPGDRHAVVCLMEPERLGLLAQVDWRWDHIDPAGTLDMHNERLRTGMQWLAEETAQPSFGSALQASCILTLLALELHRHFRAGRDVSTDQARETGKLSARQLARLKDLVEGSADPASLSLAALAGTCQLPARELSTLFKASTGQTLRSYVAATHIARAKLLLADEELLIKQVAYRSGFRSAAAFGEAFRRATGLTPLQYRQALGIRAGDGVHRTH